MSNTINSPDAGRPQLVPPPGACDTHIHIYGPMREYPVMQTGAFPPPPNSGVTDYQVVQERLGLERLVVVQPAAVNWCSAPTIRKKPSATGWRFISN